MKAMIRCSACGRRRKPGHEKRVGKKEAYNKDCLTYGKWKEIDQERKAKEKAEKEKVNE
ncbi:MAG: hypothetical protein M0R32_08120 [Candidatus Cloacimonetes bacterium]|jgi:hypothetical protein|nr:hypothetical protein [Candidatus Cloacimonadota bacterium]